MLTWNRWKTPLSYSENNFIEKLRLHWNLIGSRDACQRPSLKSAETVHLIILCYFWWGYKMGWISWKKWSLVIVPWRGSDLEKKSNFSKFSEFKWAKVWICRNFLKSPVPDDKSPHCSITWVETFTADLLWQGTPCRLFAVIVSLTEFTLFIGSWK